MKVTISIEGETEQVSAIETTERQEAFDGSPPPHVAAGRGMEAPSINAGTPPDWLVQRIEGASPGVPVEQSGDEDLQTVDDGSAGSLDFSGGASFLHGRGALS